MTQHRNRTLDALSVLLPAGALGISMALASAPAKAVVVANPDSPSARLQAIRDGVSAIANREPTASTGDALNILRTWWGNGGWRNGGWGWRNGGWGWHNGGWGNGGWRNGGWGNGGWGNGWHNGGWPNFWHNW
jgi:rSAM-associated Gly-rich repeat protein